tara:strand:+ start:3729 stop:4253 length:525 start_codon:yes stop_codon:yes gene_type:complete
MSSEQHNLKYNSAELRRRTVVALPGCIGNFAASTLLALLFARWMGLEEFGVFAFAFHVIRILTLIAGLGFNQDAVRLLPRYRKAGRLGTLNGFVLTTALSTLVLGAATGATVYGVAMLSDDTHSHKALIHVIWLVPRSLWGFCWPACCGPMGACCWEPSHRPACGTCWPWVSQP